MAPALGYSKKNWGQQLQAAEDKMRTVQHIGQFIEKKTKGKGKSIAKGYNKYLGAAAGAGLGYIVGDVPGSIVGGAFGYHAGKRVD